MVKIAKTNLLKTMANMKEATKHLIALTQEKEELFYKILEENGGHIANACKEIGISRNTYNNQFKRNPSFGNKCGKIITRIKLAGVKKKPRKVVVLKEKKKNGRPTIMTPEAIKKMEDSFSQGFSISDACIFADISRETFYNYCQATEGFLDKCKALQQRPLLKSILVINKALNEGDVNTAKWYAERKRKEEFSLRSEITGEEGEAIKIKIPEITVIFTDEKD